jgi:hypothetical protein
MTSLETSQVTVSVLCISRQMKQAGTEVVICNLGKQACSLTLMWCTAYVKPLSIQDNLSIGLIYFPILPYFHDRKLYYD